MSNNQVLNVGATAFFACDLQEKFKPAINHFAEIVEVARRLVSASKILSVPLIVTEQVRKHHIEQQKLTMMLLFFVLFVSTQRDWDQPCPS